MQPTCSHHCSSEKWRPPLRLLMAWDSWVSALVVLGVASLALHGLKLVWCLSRFVLRFLRPRPATLRIRPRGSVPRWRAFYYQ